MNNNNISHYDTLVDNDTSVYMPLFSAQQLYKAERKRGIILISQ